MLDDGSTHGDGGSYLDESDQLHALDSAPGLRIPLGPKRRETSAVEAFAERMRVALAMIAHVQIVVEKLAGQHGGGRGRRQAIIYLETLKAVSRLILLACSREMIVGGGSYVPRKRRSPQSRDRTKPGPWRETDLSTVGSDPPHHLPPDCPPSPPRAPEVYTGKRSGVRLIVPPRASVVWSGRGRSSRVGASRPVASCDGSCAQYRTDGACSACRGGGSAGLRGLRDTGRGRQDAASGRLDRVACGDDVCDGGQRQTQYTSKGGGDATGFSQPWMMAGEVIHILRPLVYSYSCGPAGERSWRPWLTSLGMDAVAYACTARAGGGKRALLLPLAAGTDSCGVAVLPFLDEEQAAELKRRKMQWFLYLMRSPAFELLAEPISRGAAGVFEGVPILGGMAGYALSMLLYVQRHHFYTSAS
eukprot:jgi/Undpi1/8961/HiC_scaffold_26.g11422.m1